MESINSKYSAIILGAGAAGCFAAIETAKAGKSVLLIDHGKQIGGKIPISGGGRCNFTNLDADWTHYQSANPRFAASALSRYGPQDFIALLNRHKIGWHEKHLGQLFCNGKALEIVALLERELKKAGVDVSLNSRVEKVLHSEAGFKLDTSGGMLQSSALVVATGGLSYSSLGASPFGFALARQFGHTIIETAAALDGFVFGPKEKESYEGLQGIALEKTQVQAGGTRFEEALLFTHKGISGPAALQASLYWKPGQEIKIDLWSGGDFEKDLLEFKKRNPSKYASDFLLLRWPKQLIARWCDLADLTAAPLARCSDTQLRKFAQTVSAWTWKPVSTVGYHRAEVTRGGVDTKELNQKSMQSRIVPGLYFVGEVVDITGELGGYNFQWAWSSGWAAGQHLGGNAS